jgi:hypothetical protein
VHRILVKARTAINITAADALNEVIIFCNIRRKMHAKSSAKREKQLEANIAAITCVKVKKCEK